MNAFSIALLDAIIFHGNDLVKRNALIICRNELAGTESDAPAVDPIAPVVELPVVESAVAPTVVEVTEVDQESSEDSEHDRPPEAFSESMRKSSAYDSLYEEGKGQYLLLDGKDEIEEGDEWIIKPDLSTNRARRWRDASDIGSSVSEFSRSNYRRRI